MDKLRQIIKILEVHKIDSTTWLNNSLSRDSKLLQLYERITTTKKDNEAATELELYGENGTRSFSKLKHDLKQKLLPLFLQIDYRRNGYNKYERHYADCYRHWVIIRLMIRIGLRQIGIEELKKVVKKAHKCSITHIELEGLRLLRHHYSTVEGRSSNFMDYQQQIQTLQRKYQAELQAEYFFTEITSYYANDKSTKAFIDRMCSDFIQQLQIFQQQLNTLDYNMYYHALLVWQALSNNRYDLVVQHCQAAIRVINDFPLVPPPYLRHFHAQMIISYTQLKDYEAGRQAIATILPLARTGNTTWFIIRRMEFILALHTQQYSSAWNIFTQATRHASFSRLPPVEREYWRLYKAYLWYLVKQKKVTLSATHEKQFHQLRIHKLLNELPIASKDKRGLNISVIVIQLLYYLEYQRFDEVFNRVDTLKKYSSRYLREQPTNRSYHFLRLIIILANNGFRRKATLEKISDHYTALKDANTDAINHAYGVEVIPYEDLWEMILGGVVR